MTSQPGPSDLVDIVDLRAADAEAQLEAALTTTGFVQLVGHDLSPATCQHFRTASDAFFALDHATKSHYVHDDPAANRGYRARGSEALSYSLGTPSPPDLFESFNSAPMRASPGESQLFQATPWPSDVVPAFEAAAIEMFDAFAGLAQRIDVLVSRLLGIDWLAERSGRGPDTLASINYRPEADGSEPLLDGQQRMGAHSDYTTFTLLDADSVRGLQIVSPAGEWVDVIPEPGALLMNVGDLLAMFTNNTWPSTLHRVVPLSAGSAPYRRSVAFFHYPNLDVEIAPLSAFVSDATPAQYAPVGVEEHLLGKLVAPKHHEITSAASTVAGRPTA